MRHILLVLTMCFPLTSMAAPELKGTPEELKTFLHPTENTISITREAEETVFKDIAIVSIVATTEDDELAVAIKQNAQLRADISDVLVTSGIRLSDINNAKFSTAPDYGWFGDKPDSYKVSNVISIRITDEKGLESIAKIVDKNKEITLLGTKYEHSKKEEFIEKVKAKAMDDVLKEKDFYAKKLGLELQAVGFIDNSFLPRDDIEAIQVTGMRMRSAKASYASDSQPARKPSFEKVIYKARVTVSFKVK